MAALRQPNFLVYSAGRVASGMAMTMLNAAIAWQVYAISHSAFQLAMIGLARFLPSLGLTLVGGSFADGHDRKRIVILTQFVPLATSAILFLATVNGSVPLALIYGLVLVVAWDSRGCGFLATAEFLFRFICENLCLSVADDFNLF